MKRFGKSVAQCRQKILPIISNRNTQCSNKYVQPSTGRLWMAASPARRSTPRSCSLQRTSSTAGRAKPRPTLPSPGGWPTSTASKSATARSKPRRQRRRVDRQLLRNPGSLIKYLFGTFFVLIVVLACLVLNGASIGCADWLFTLHTAHKETFCANRKLQGRGVVQIVQ